MLQGLGNVVNCNEVTLFLTVSSLFPIFAPGLRSDGSERTKGPERQKVQAWPQEEATTQEAEETQQRHHGGKK